MTGSGSYPHTQDSSPVMMVYMKSGSLFVEFSMSCETVLSTMNKIIRNNSDLSIVKMI